MGIMFLGAVQTVSALDVTGYSAAVNDRFASGFPTSPVPNISGSFVGATYDWSGVGWSTTTYAASSYKGLALLSPRHFLTAQHYENGGLVTQGVRIRTSSGIVVSQTNTGIDNLGYGLVLTNAGTTAPDLAMGTLAAPIAASEVARYGVLDLYATSSSTLYSAYNNLSLLAYGRGATTNGSPRAAATSVNLAAAFNSNPIETAVRTLYTGSASVQLVEGDSASPLLHGWTNPNGGHELTVLGVNSATDFATYNYMSFLAAPGAMANTNNVMTPDGYALKVVGNPTNTWVGSSSTSIGNRSAWGLSPPTSAPSDKYVLFNGATAGSGRAVTVDTAANERGLYFKSTGSGTLGFTFSGASTLTVGRGGITNYDASRQTIASTIALGDHQYWDVGPGGVTAAAISTGTGFLLEIAGSGTARITGNVSGGGGLAVSGHRLELSGSSSYTGRTWVHAGTLSVGGTIASSSGVSLAAAGVLAGTGRVSAIAGAGSVDPGTSPGILTGRSVDPSAGLDFNFEFTQTGSPTWGTGTASGNDVLRLTSGSAPFTTPLASANAVNVFLDVSTLSLNDVFRGGFFTDLDTAFLGSVQNASWNYYLATAGGTTTYNGVAYSLYGGPYTFALTTVAETAAFSGGSEAGYVTQFTVVPEPAMGAAVAVAIAACVAGWRRRAGGPG